MISPPIPTLFTDQAEQCRLLGSPFTARVLMLTLRHLDPDSPLGHAILTSGARPEEALPLRVAGGLHALARADDPDLAPVYPPNDPTDAALNAALARMITARGDALLPWLASPPQTNEVARSAVLIAAGHWLTARFGLPLHLSELGASAGLNLLWDHYALALPGLTLGPLDPVLTLQPDWQGVPPVLAQPRVLSRAGVDLAPLDPVTDCDRLLAYVWADQTARRQRCQAALALATRLRPLVAQGDAADWIEGRLAQRFDGLHLVFHTVAATYFPPATTARLAAALSGAGARATAARPLAHLSMEYDGPTPGAALTLQIWPTGQVIRLGRADFHGRWVTWAAP